MMNFISYRVSNFKIAMAFWTSRGFHHQNINTALAVTAQKLHFLVQREVQSAHLREPDESYNVAS